MAAERIIPKGTTNVFLTVPMRDSSTGQLKGSIAYGTPVVKYQRDGSATAVTVTLVDGTLGTHLDNSWKETQITGKYQLCLPDAAFATGANGVTVTITSSGCVDKELSVALVDFNLLSATPDVNTSGLATASALSTVDTVVDAIKVVTDYLNGMLEDGTSPLKKFTTEALEEAPFGNDAVNIWTQNISSGFSEGSAAKTLYDMLLGLAAASAASTGPVWVNPATATLDESLALNRIITLVRQDTNEPSAKAKYSDTDLIRRIEVGFQAVLAEINSVANNKVLVRHNLSLVDGSDLFLLPPGIDTIQRAARLCDDGYRGVDWSLAPRAHTNIFGPGILMEGRYLRFDPKWRGSEETLELQYVPNGDFKMHYGTADSATATTLVMGATPTKGSLDTREHAYAGATLRIVSDSNGYIQERTISSYDRATRTATVEMAFDPVPSGTITYEVVPSYYNLLERVVATHVALDLVAAAKDQTRYNLLAIQYRKILRAIRMQLGRREGIIGDRFQGPGYK